MFCLSGLLNCFLAVMYRTCAKKRDLSNRVYASDEARADALEKAEKLESSLEATYPTFIKSMLQSHVSGGFWLVYRFGVSLLK